MGHSISATEIANHVGGRIAAGGERSIERVAGLESAGEGEIAYLENEKFLDAAVASRASCLLFSESLPPAFRMPPTHCSTLIVVDSPKLASPASPLAFRSEAREPEIHASAVVATSARLALTVYIGPHVVIGENTKIEAGTRIEAGVVVGDNVTIGSDCVLHPSVTLYDGVTLGNRVVLHAGVCIGADGFGYVRDDMGYHKFPQIGTVVIEDDVELGAHTCVDRGALGRTRIGRGTKIDNLVQVGHNVDIGERVVIASQTGISGSVVIEDDCVIGGQVGFGDHIRVLSGAVIGSKAGVLPGKIVRPAFGGECR